MTHLDLNELIRHPEAYLDSRSEIVCSSSVLPCLAFLKYSFVPDMVEKLLLYVETCNLYSVCTLIDRMKVGCCRISTIALTVIVEAEGSGFLCLDSVTRDGGWNDTTRSLKLSKLDDLDENEKEPYDSACLTVGV